jgi:hypothetical protein
MEESDYSLIEILSRHLPEGIKENQGKTSIKKASVPIMIQTQYPLNMFQIVYTVPVYVAIS